MSWERLREKPTYHTEDSQFILSFKVKTDPKSVLYVAFTYPYTYKYAIMPNQSFLNINCDVFIRELQLFLSKLDRKYSTGNLSHEILSKRPATSIYYHRECVIKTSEGRKLDLITLSSCQGINADREAQLKGLFPARDNLNCRPFKFDKKRVVFISARVHPGETQSSFVFNGFVR